MMANVVKIKIMAENDRLTVAQFDSSGVPEDADFGLESDHTCKEMRLKAKDSSCGQLYVGNSHQSDLYIGVRHKGVLEVHPISMFRMCPVVEPPEPSVSQLLTQTPLTFKEQMEEMKDKFGSRKTQRQLASKRKYAIEFGEEDVDQIEIKTQRMVESAMEQTASQSTLNDSLDILPHQNRDAICVQEVYDINEIITSKERNVLKQFENEMFNQINNQLIMKLISDPKDSEQRIIAIYINLITSLLNVKMSDLKTNSLPELNSEVKELLFSKYLGSKIVKNKYQYMLNGKQKDRLLIHGIILSIIIHNFRPIEMELLQKSFKVALRQMKKVVEIIGCYVENSKNETGVNVKSVVFRLPLNTFSDQKKNFKRK